MENIKVNISELKNIVSKINLAVEKTKLNPKSGWIELESFSEDKMIIKVANYDYYLEAYIPISCENYSDDNKIHATVTAETFIPLVSKLEDEYVEMYEHLNALIFKAKKSEYTFPIIKELGVVKSVTSINFNNAGCIRSSIAGKSLASIAETNAKGLIDSVFSKEIQQFIYVDEIGAITFTENIYINPFNASSPFKFLLNGTQAKLLQVFDKYDDVEISVENVENYEQAVKVKFTVNNLTLTLITQSKQTTDKFPSIKLRELSNAVSETHIILDKKALDKALARLMVFDKKFDITVMNYSKLVFGENSLKLISIKNKNYEEIAYDSSTNAFEHESMIRFADLVNQLKAINTPKIDISYGDSPAIVINGNIKQLIPEIQEVQRS